MKKLYIVSLLFGIALIPQAILAKPARMQPLALNLQVTNIAANRVELEWNSSRKGKLSRVIVKNAENGLTVQRIHTKKNQYIVKHLKADVPYTFRVKVIQSTDSADTVVSDIERIRTDYDFTPESYALEDTFEQTNLGIPLSESETDTPRLEYVAGYEGYGIKEVYATQEDGSVARANLLRYYNTDGQYLDPNIGTIEFYMSPESDPVDNSDTHGLFNAWAHDSSTYYNDAGVAEWGISVYQNTVIAYRDFGPCIRDLSYTMHEFTPDNWYKVTLTWRGQDTRLYINDESVGNFEMSGRENFERLGDYIAFGDDLFVTDNLRISHESYIDPKYLTNESTTVSCPDFNGWLDETPDETYQDIQLHNFDDSARSVAKQYIDDLPTGYDNDIQHIVIVPDDQYELGQGPTAAANLQWYGRAMFLKESLFNSEELMLSGIKTFFHEAGHAQIYGEELNYGGPTGPSKAKEWSRLSGIDAYAGECANPDGFVLADGFLTGYGSTMPDEDLAEWVGFAFAMYSVDASFASLVNPDSSKYNSIYVDKLNFLLDHEFITETMHTTLMDPSLNSGSYEQFN